VASLPVWNLIRGVGRLASEFYEYCRAESARESCSHCLSGLSPCAVRLMFLRRMASFVTTSDVALSTPSKAREWALC
jgi:hypothetical protein